MNKRFPLYTLLTLILMGIVSACNSNSETFVSEGDFSNCSVTSFSLVKDDSVLAHLDSVFFSIDLVNAEIFNADSLPMGTKVDKLLVNVGTSSASGCDITYRIPGTSRDTTINFLQNPKDSINFADGPVKLLVTSYDGLSKREYTVKLNVHKVVPDTLFWDDAALRTLPGKLAAPTAQKTVEYQGKVYCFTTDGSQSSMAVTENPYYNDWESSIVSLPAGADIKSLCASSASFYILDSAGQLFVSADGRSWRATGVHIDYLYGGYMDKAVGARKDADGWKHVTYPASAEVAVPTGCPVSGTSQLVAYETKWSSSVLALFIGGRDASGTLVGSTWGYDGNRWAKVSTRDIDETEDVTLFPYFTPRVSSTNWSVTERSALIAVGGRYESEDGIVASNLVYVSYDQGITWAEASSYMQLPEFIPAFACAQAIVVPTEMSVDNGGSSRAGVDGWLPIGRTPLPAWASPVPVALSRAVAPVDEWECPYIYLFGGEDADGLLFDTLWKGVIRRFSFRPLY
ncbi:MAG: DUF6242 domain-containing protein [Staphylococcus sp.]|nr:DUF6242 domain-containing protein [Staphylococcus sp.]